MPPFWNDDYAAAKETRIQREGAGTQQSQCDGDRCKTDSCKNVTAVCGACFHEHLTDKSQIAHRRKRTRKRCQVSDQHAKPYAHFQQPDEPRRQIVTAWCREQTNAPADGMRAYNKPKNYETYARPSVRKAGKKFLQSIAPGG
jgi:hypothetical protein